MLNKPNGNAVLTLVLCWSYIEKQIADKLI